MPAIAVKSTYSLDIESVCILGKLAQRWKVSKSEVLRRAIRVANLQELPVNQAALDALDQL